MKQKIYDTGNLRGLCKDLYLLTKEHPGCTLGELAAKSKNKKPRGELSKRMADLDNWGLVKKGPRRTCAFSGRMACTWMTTKSNPNRPSKKRKSKKDNNSEVLAPKTPTPVPMPTGGALLKKTGETRPSIPYLPVAPELLEKNETSPVGFLDTLLGFIGIMGFATAVAMFVYLFIKVILVR